MESGTINFTSLAQGPTIAATSPIVAGKFSIPRGQGPAPGNNKVEITYLKSFGKKEAGMPFPKGTMVDDVKQVIPPEFNYQSKLVAEIKSGTNTLDFALPTK